MSNPPSITTIGAKIAILERRQAHLERQLAEGAGSKTSLEYSRNEIDALKAAVLALQYHRATVAVLNTPITLLREIVEVYGEPKKAARLKELIMSARVVLEDFG